jgi:Hemerythrin HHE cation binding domain
LTLGLELYQAQHAELLHAAAALKADLAGEWRAETAGRARLHLAHLSGKLTFHLQMEDRSLYPAFLASGDPAVRSVATRFEASMGGLRASADAFFLHWLRPDAIAVDPDGFRLAARALLGALADRIAAEDRELYPLATRP